MTFSTFDQFTYCAIAEANKSSQMASMIDCNVYYQRGKRRNAHIFLIILFSLGVVTHGLFSIHRHKLIQ